MILRYTFRNILPIILLFPFAIQAMNDNNTQLKIGAHLGSDAFFQLQKSYLSFAPGELKACRFNETMTVSTQGATATIKVVEATQIAANVQCTLHYMHTNKWAKFFPCFLNPHEEETLTSTVTLDCSNRENINPVVVRFGNPAFLRHKKSSAVIPVGHEYLAALTLWIQETKPEQQ